MAVGVSLGSGVGVAATAGVVVAVGILVFMAVGVGVAVGASPQADSTIDKNTSTYKSFFISGILCKDVARYHTAFVPFGRGCTLTFEANFM
jgi:hypothetical protein